MAVTDAPPIPSISLDPASIEALADALTERIAARLPQPPDTEDGWMDTRAAADYIGLTPNALHKIAARDGIPCSRPAGTRKLRFRRSELDEWMREDRREPRF
jgi:excisionase family DNA binding protein